MRKQKYITRSAHNEAARNGLRERGLRLVWDAETRTEWSGRLVSMFAGDSKSVMLIESLERKEDDSGMEWNGWDIFVQGDNTGLVVNTWAQLDAYLGNYPATIRETAAVHA